MAMARNLKVKLYKPTALTSSFPLQRRYVRKAPTRNVPISPPARGFPAISLIVFGRVAPNGTRWPLFDLCVDSATIWLSHVVRYFRSLDKPRE